MKFLKLLRWIAYNIAELALLYYFLFQGVIWCGNLYKFIAWLGLFVVSFLFVILSVNDDDELSESIIKAIDHVPQKLNTFIDMSAAFVLASFGFWGLGAIKIINVLLSGVVKSKAEQTTNNTGEKP